MRKLTVVVLCIGLISSASAQRFHVGIFGGLASYNGDLVDRVYPKKGTSGAIGLTGNYELTDNIMLRGGFTFARVGGADKYAKDADLQSRNLSFETAISEFSLVGEYYLNSLNTRRFSPYVFGGLAVYHFNPFTHDGTEKVFLKPLGTEGQGLPGYANREAYKLTQLAIPFGAGLKYAINDNLHIGAEVGLRKLFTDYLDDVSSAYADPADLLAGRGQRAVDLSYRGDELPGGDPAYPGKGSQRGGEQYKDFYYFTGLHLTYRLNGKDGGGLFGGGRGRSKTGCPTNVY